MNKTSRSAVILVVVLLVVNVFSVYGAAQDDTDAFVPAFMSFIVPGAGQLINDEPDKAIVHFGVFSGIWLATTTFYTTLLRVAPLAHLAWSGYSAYDAYQVARGRKTEGIFSSLSFKNEKGGFQNVSIENLGLNSNQGLSLARVD